jgi:hypothetical protein
MVGKQSAQAYVLQRHSHLQQMIAGPLCWQMAGRIHHCWCWYCQQQCCCCCFQWGCGCDLSFGQPRVLLVLLLPVLCQRCYVVQQKRQQLLQAAVVALPLCEMQQHLLLVVLA